MKEFSVPPLVELLFTCDQDFYHASSVYAGLDRLARRGDVRLRWRRPTRPEARLAADPIALCLLVRAVAGGAPRKLVIDLRDQGDLFAAAPLAECDAYYKRSYHEPDLAALPPEQAASVRPFGLNYACRTGGSTARLFAAAGGRLLLQGKAGVRRLAHHVALPRVEEFEQDAAVPLEPTIVFQTRVWEEEDAAPGESEAVNDRRVAVVRALREAFGERFRGGLVPTPLAVARYPREVTAFPSRRRLYTAMSKRNLIGIYTVGLHASTAFKLPEYLAASQCVVAEPPRNGLPLPLVPGVHYLPFETADDCVRACGRLLADPQLAARMRQSNKEYYDRNVAPDARLLRLLSEWA